MLHYVKYRINKGRWLTNWNSVAAPAPASAFLSAPAKTQDINYLTEQARHSTIYPTFQDVIPTISFPIAI